MQVHTSIGNNHQLVLRDALLVYTHNQQSFITRHSVTVQEKAPPSLGPAQPLSTAFLDDLIRSTRGKMAAEILPDNVLARGEQTIVWWTAAQRRQMFYESSDGKCKALNGRIFAQPPLVWKVANGELLVRALKEDKRPSARTKLAFAPFWNTNGRGLVCLGSMRRPDGTSVAAIPGWERGFYESAFTHSNVGRLTRHKAGFEALWSELTGKKKTFPAASLIPLPETLLDFVRGGEPHGN